MNVFYLQGHPDYPSLRTSNKQYHDQHNRSQSPEQSSLRRRPNDPSASGRCGGGCLGCGHQCLTSDYRLRACGVCGFGPETYLIVIKVEYAIDVLQEDIAVKPLVWSADLLADNITLTKIGCAA